MNLDLFDADIMLGMPSVPPDRETGFFADEEDITREMSRFSISRAVVRHVHGREYSPVYGNRKLDSIQSESIEKCYTVLPPYTEEMGSENDIVERITSGGARFVTFFPMTHHYFFSTHTCGSLLGLLAEAEIIVLIDNSEVDYERLYEICSSLPEIHIIVLGIDYRDNREVYLLLRETDNIYIGTSRFCGKGFIEDVAGKFGPQRLVFSSAMPLCSPGGPIASLVYADICPDSKKMIAGNTMRFMLGEIHES